MNFKEWLSKSDPSDVDVNALVNSTLQWARAAATGVSPVSALRREDVATALKEGAARSPGDRVVGAREGAAKRIALGTSYDQKTAEQIVDTHLQRLSAEEKDKLDQDEVALPTAESIINDVGLPGVDVSVDVSQPSLLNAPTRIVFAGGSWVALIATIALSGVAGIRNTGSSGFFVAVGIIGFLLVVALLVLVMGYGSVKVKTSVGAGAKTTS